MIQTFAYYLFILSLAGFSRSNSQSDGCENFDFNEQNCIIRVHCISFVEISFRYFREHLQCERQNIELSYVDLYKEHEIIPYVINTDDNRLQMFLVSLNFSYNNYLSMPQIYQYPNLRSLNFSHNNIDVAKLFNNEELQSLTEIDFSYNEVVGIEIDGYNYYNFLKLVKLNLAHNILKEIPNGILSNFRDLEYLDLSYNHITNISLQTFDGLQNLVSLNLSHNSIVDINLSLIHFSNLIELNLNNNNIKTISKLDFQILHVLKVLDLSYNSIITIEGDAFKNLISLESLDLSYNTLSNIDKNFFSENINLTNVNLSNNKLTDLPINLFKGKSVHLFSISDNFINGIIKRGLFEGLKLENTLDLGYQAFTSIEDNAFFGLDMMKKLLLNNNLIHSISKNSFKTLKSLAVLDLSNNRITNLDFDKDDLWSLESLLLQCNFISQISNIYFKNLHRLKFIDISQNNISHIESQSFLDLNSINNFQILKNPLTGILKSNIFKGLNSVPILDLSCTFINIIQNASLDGMIELSQLNISHSKVNDIQFNAFINTGNILIMDFSYNRLKSFVVNTTELIKVKQLLLNNNLIMVLPNSFVKGIIHLEKISLAYNSLSFLNNDTFKDQKDLSYLDLSNNLNIQTDFSLIRNSKNLDTLILSNITSNLSFKNYKEVALRRLTLTHSYISDINRLDLSELNKLRILQLGYNNIVQLTTGTFFNLIDLREIDVSFNKISTIEPGVFKNNFMLNKLNLSHNALSELGYGIFLGLTHLNIMDLSFNLINSLETEQLYAVQSLSKLIIDHNRIKSLSLEDISGTNLSVLSIGDNPLPCKILSNIIKYKSPKLIITSIRYVDTKEHNSNGITCKLQANDNVEESEIDSIPSTGNNTDSLIVDIRNILRRLSSKQMPNKTVDVSALDRVIKLEEENVQQISHLVDLVSELHKETKTTNDFLERILKITVALNSINRSLTLPTKENFSSDSIFEYLNKVRQDFSNEMTIEKERILDEVERKLFVLKKQSNSTAFGTSANEDKRLSAGKDSDSSTFVKTCVALTLFVVVCSVLVMIYKSRMFIFSSRHRSTSTRQIADDMETSNI